MAENVFQKMSFTQKIVYFILFVLLVLFILVMFVIRPSMASIEQTREAVAGQSQELKERYLRGMNARIISRNLDEIKDGLEVLDQVFIKKDRYLDLIILLENLAEENNLEERLSILTESSEDRNFYQVVPVNMELTGSFKDQLSFLSALKDKPSRFNINSIRITSKNPESITELRERRMTGEEIVLSEPDVLDEEILEEDDEVVPELEEESNQEEEEDILEESIIPEQEVSLMIFSEVYWLK